MTIVATYGGHSLVGNERVSFWYLSSDDDTVTSLGPHPVAIQTTQQLFQDDPVKWVKSILANHRHPDTCRIHFAKEKGKPTIRIVFPSSAPEWHKTRVRRNALKTLSNIVYKHRS